VREQADDVTTTDREGGGDTRPGDAVHDGGRRGGPRRERRDPARRPQQSEELLELLHDVLRAVRRDATDRLGDDVTPGQLRLLRTLDRCERPRRLGELAAALDVAPRSVTSKVDQAEDDGLVRRVPDPDDRRATLVELTDAGHDLLDRLSARRHEGVRARLEVLDADEQRTLLDLLRRVADAPPEPSRPVPSS